MKQTYAIIGDPVSHSRSPELYAPMFRKFGIEAEFMRVRVPHDDLHRIKSIINELGLCGFAVTMPHKTAILKYLDSIAESAEAAGSANIITISNGLLTGHNTDGAGTVNALSEAQIYLAGKHSIILGGGGAASGAGAALLRSGCKVSYIKRSAGASLNQAILEFERLHSRIPVDIIINATPLGMDGMPKFEELEFLERLKPRAVVDMVYNSSGQTELIARANALGIVSICGEQILYQQGILAFNLWTGHDYK